MLGRRRRTRIGPPDGQSLRVIATAIQGLVPLEALRQILMVCTTWGVTYANGAKIGTMRKSMGVCCALPRGAIPSLEICLLHVALVSPPVIVALISGFVV
jgi:hypothetical protein